MPLIFEPLLSRGRVLSSQTVYGELPPTAGLPLKFGDFFGKSGNFAETIAKLFNLPPMLLECSGTASLIIALHTLKRLSLKDSANPRDEVIIPAFNCPLVVLAIHHCSLKPVICDTAQNSFDFDFNHLEQLAGENTLAIIPTHIGGQLADVERALLIARKIGAYCIEDCAQALGANVGKGGDIAFFSLAVGKGLTLFEGGLLTAKDPDLLAQLQITHNNLVKPDFFADKVKLAELFGYYCCYRPLLLELFYGMSRRKALKNHDYMNAVGDYFDETIPIFEVGKKREAIGAKAALRLPQFLKQTRTQALQRIEILENNKILQKSGFKIIKSKDPQQAIFPFIMILAPSVEIQQKAMQSLWSSSLGVTRLFVLSLLDYDYLNLPLKGDKSSTPNAVDFAGRMLTITNSLMLDDKSFNQIVKELEAAVL